MIVIDSIKDIITNYENFIIDQWGVIHDGIYGYKHAIEAIDYLNSQNKRLFIISNSSKRKKSSQEKLPYLGFNKNSFVNILTSGEMIWQNVKKKYSQLKIKKKCFHIYDKSKKDSLLFRENLNLLFVEKIEEADFILACTPFVNMKPIEYIPILDIAVERQLTMYCANPDFESIEKKNNQNLICMGAIAEIYKKMGGKVIIKGKPENEIYIECTKSINLDKSKTIAVGDSIFHDIKGANNFSIDSILVQSGIHEDIRTINKICKNHQIKPKYLIENFSI